MESITNIKPAVTLTTDWVHNDYYHGMLRGKLASSCPEMKVLDLAHAIPSFSLNHAAFVVRHSFSYFPAGTIHLIFLNTESNIISRLLVLESNQHYFVLPDNGIIGLIFNNIPEKVFEVRFPPKGSFASIDTYVRVAKELFNGVPMEQLGEPINDYSVKVALRATIDESIINGSIIYIDSYRNAITNISKSLFERVGQERNFNIFVQSNYNKINKISTSYGQVEPGELLVLFNSANLLEVAIRNGYAAELLSLKVGGSVRVNFY